VSGLSTDIQALADIEDGTTATNAISNVGNNISSVVTTAANISGVNSFAERYRVDSSDPTTSLDEGDLIFNTTDNNLKFYNGTSWTAIAPGIANVVDDTTPQLGGNLDVNGNSIVSVSNGNISITPDGTGKVIIDGLSHPTADGTNGQALVTNGSGVLSFDTIQASELSTEGAVFSNYNTITSNVTTTTTSTKNSFLKGVITINSGFTWTISGTGSLDIIWCFTINSK